MSWILCHVRRYLANIWYPINLWGVWEKIDSLRPAFPIFFIFWCTNDDSGGVYRKIHLVRPTFFDLRGVGIKLFCIRPLLYIFAAFSTEFMQKWGVWDKFFLIRPIGLLILQYRLIHHEIRIFKSGSLLAHQLILVLCNVFHGEADTSHLVFAKANNSNHIT